jgi:hypothetical protein
MIKFRGIQINGTHDLILAHPPELQVVRTYFWGLRGESEIVGGKAGRALTCYIWLHNRYANRLDIENAITTINSWVGENGVLVEEDTHNNVTLTFNEVTFEGFTREVIQGRDSNGPLRDYAGTIDGGWFQPGTLAFRQLVPQ